MRYPLGMALGLWLSCAAGALPERVTLRVHSFPPSQVFQETATSSSYLSRSDQPFQVQPPVLLDAQGQPAQYLNGFLVLRAAGHGEFRIPVASQDWSKGQLPAEGGVYRLTPNSTWVALQDYLTNYPLACAAGAGVLLGAGVFAGRWRRTARSRGAENRRLSARLKSTGDPLLGKSLGRYTVHSRLGQGGMGAVYRVHDGEGGEYACKVIYFDELEAAQLQRFRREFKVIQQLQHPALVRGMDYGEEEGLAYCVMELVKGKTLEQHIVPKGLPWVEIWPWVRGILEGLACAHASGVVHRDLKPANIMISPQGVKILDFGLARHSDLTAVTLTGQAFGTPSYIAPEQISAPSSEVEPRSDIYSLGIILFELLTGEPPFHSEDVREIIAQHLTQNPARLSTVVTGNPPELDTILARMLAKNPANRYASAERLLEVFTALETGPAPPGEATTSDRVPDAPTEQIV